MKRPPRQGRSSFIKAIILIIGLILIIALYNRIPHIVSNINDLLTEADVDPYQRGEFSEAQQDSLKKELAGFWMYDEDRLQNSGFHHVFDRIEIRENGIVWQVKKDIYYLPSGDSAVVTLIQQAYLRPFSWCDEEKSLLQCEVRGLKRVYFFDSDTCYIPAFKKTPELLNENSYYVPTMDETWYIRKGESDFIWEDRRYSSYEKKDISLFFPKGSISLVDSINISECSGKGTVLTYVRDKLAADAQGQVFDKRKKEDVDSLMKNYYINFCLIPILRSSENYEKYSVSQLAINFKVSAQGSVESVKVSAPKLTYNLRLKEIIINEIQLWRFPSVTEKGEAFNVTYELAL